VFLVLIERMSVRRAVAHYQSGDMRTGLGQGGAVHNQDGAIESVAGENGTQMFRWMVQ
jgi:hypothetical protein